MTTAVSTEVILPPDGTEDIPPAYPVVSIVQPMSQIPKAVAGFFYHSDTQEQTAEFDGVLLIMKDTRAMFVEGDDKPVCRSNDGKVPANNQPLWKMDEITLKDGKHAVPFLKDSLGNRQQPLNCANCVFSDWGDGVPPACGNAYEIVAARNGDPEDLVKLRLKGTSIRPFRQWVAKSVKPRGLRLYQQQVHLETEEHTGPSRKWHQLVITSVPVPMEDVLVYAAVLEKGAAHVDDDFDEFE